MPRFSICVPVNIVAIVAMSALLVVVVVVVVVLLLLLFDFINFLSGDFIGAFILSAIECYRMDRTPAFYSIL